MGVNKTLLAQIIAAMGVRSTTPILISTTTSGVAPYGLVFDGTQTTASTGLNAFRDLLYFFDFGDDTCTNYTSGVLTGTTRNRYVGGPVTAFTYETPGTYTAQMWVYDGISVSGPVTQTITVQDPNVVFAGAATTVVSSTGNFAGAPIGANQVTIDNTTTTYNTVMTNAAYSGSNKRILFREGEIFNCTSSYVFNTRTNFFVGTFGGDGSGYATIRATATSIVPMLGNTSSAVAFNSDKTVITGLHFTQDIGSGFTGTDGIGMTNKPVTAGAYDYANGNTTVHKCRASNINSLSKSIGHYGLVFSESSCTNINNGVAVSGGIGIYSSLVIRGAIINCDLDCNFGGEHVIRYQGGSYSAIISNKTQRPAATKAFITFRGLGGLVYPAKFNLIGYNFADGSTAGAIGISQCIQVAPQNNTAVEPIEDVVVESNFSIVPDATTLPAINQAVRAVWRNNVFHYPNVAASTGYGMQISAFSSGTVGSSDCLFVNNTWNYAVSANGFTGFINQTGATGTNRVYNNILYAPNSLKTGANNGSAPSLVVDQAANLIIGQNSTNSQIKLTDPLFVGGFTSITGFALQSGSPYKDVAVNYNVRTDAIGKLRVGTLFDAGALNAPDKQVDAWSLIILPVTYMDINYVDDNYVD